MPVSSKEYIKHQKKVDIQIKTVEAYGSKWKIEIMVYYDTQTENYNLKGEITEQTGLLRSSITYSELSLDITNSSNIRNKVEELSETLLEKVRKEKDAEEVNIDINVTVN